MGYVDWERGKALSALGYKNSNVKTCLENDQNIIKLITIFFKRLGQVAESKQNNLKLSRKWVRCII